MSIKEICALQRGQIIDLKRKLDDPLEMVVEGRVIGLCMPVQIDGRLGIRILEMEGESSQPHDA